MANAGDDKATDELYINDDYTSSLFQCCICLDLLYKPIVLSCGHISCFWCVHRAMQSVQESNCAVCRQSFQHFPSICPLLHVLLLKLEPVAYKRREKEVIEEEKHLHMQSPQYVDEVALPNSGPTNDSGGSTNPNLQQTAENGSVQKFTMEDALCSSCNELLYLPSVLNCGHVYCEACLKSMAGERMECKVCGAPHPGQFPNVCLDLDHFLEESFPEKYASRRQTALVNKSQHQHGDTSSSSSAQGDGNAKKKDMRSFLDDVKYNVHVGIGCDCCGLYPIKGKRYKCMDCKEEVGFDLCESCYSTKSKLPGRFNQQHTSDHMFKEDNSRLLPRILLQGAAMENYEEDLYEDEYADEDGGNEFNHGDEDSGNEFNPDQL